MNIALDITPTESAHALRGVGVYTSNLIEALKEYDKKNSYSFFTRGQNIPKSADLVHYPYFDPFFLTLPINKYSPVVVTVHDLIPLVFPDKFPAGLRGSLAWQIQKFSLLGARRIITDSKCSKRDIERITGIAGNKIDAIYLAPTIRPSNVKLTGYPKHFVLYVGDVNWNKNVQSLIKAVGSRRLVLVGKAFLNNNLSETKEINALISSMGLGQQIIRAGFVDNLSALYAQADCLVVPSFYEGFGLSVLDAMISGCPVVAADNSSLSEIAGPAVRVSTDPASIAAGIEKAIAERKTLIKEGIAWVKKFTWQKVARQTIATYEKAISNNSGL